MSLKQANQLLCRSNIVNDDYPTVDLDFLLQLLDSSPKVERVLERGSVRTILFVGSKSVGYRTRYFTPLENNQVELEYAMSTAIIAKKLPELLHWLEVERAWKEGAYSQTLLDQLGEDAESGSGE